MCTGRPNIAAEHQGPWASCFLFFPAVSCGSPPSVMNAVFDPNTNISYGSSVYYTCIPGYMFTRGVTSNRIHCDASGKWMPQISGCDRMY